MKGAVMRREQEFQVIKTVENMFKSGRTWLVAGLVAGAALTSLGALRAQEAANGNDTVPPRDEASAASFDLPSDIKMLGKEDPNVRKATAVVNGFVITGTDIDQRLALTLDANKGVKITDEDMQQLRAQVLRSLIDETLQIQAAKSQDIAVSDDDVEGQYQRAAAHDNKTVAQLDDYLAKIGSSKASLMRQIKGELSWQNLLARNVTPFVNVSREEVNELMDRLRASKGTEEYRVGEIYLSSTPETEQAVFNNAKRIVDQLQNGASFQAYARQFSEASTAAVGGDLGWIRLPQLPKALADAVQPLEPGQLVGPVQLTGGFSIVYLIDKRQVLTADPRDALLSLKQISITFAPGTSEEQAQARVNEFSSRVQQIRGCGDVEAVAGLMGADVVSNDQVQARAIPEPLQSTLLKLQVGQATPPFGSLDQGVRVLMLCGRDDPKVESGPNFDELMGQLQDDRIGKRAQRYLRDLRRDAIIEYN